MPINELLNRAALFERFGRYESALEAVQWLEAPPGDEPSASLNLMRLQVWSAAGTLHRQLARYGPAEELHQRAQALSIEVHGAAADETSMARNPLGIVYKYTGQFGQGEALYREALKNLIEPHGELDSMVAVVYHNLGSV